MADPKSEPGAIAAVTAVLPCVRFTPAEAARNKATRDARRKSIREQNARSKSLK